MKLRIHVIILSLLELSLLHLGTKNSKHYVLDISIDTFEACM